SQLARKATESLRFTSGDPELRTELYDSIGEAIFENFASVRSKVEALLDKWSAGESEDDDEENGESAKRSIPEKKRKKLLDPKTWARDGRLVEVANALREELGDRLYEDHNEFRAKVDAALDKLGLALTAPDKKALLRAVSWTVESAPPVIKSVHKPSKSSVDPLHGRYETTVDGKRVIVEYEPDADLRDSEQIPLLEPGGIEAFFRREVLPHTSDAWIDDSATKIGYEVSFTRHFYKPQPLRTLDEIRADILALERESEGLIAEIVGTGGRSSTPSQGELASLPGAPETHRTASRSKLGTAGRVES
ncbi:MAG: hypothetical protein ABL886_09710, partial [Rhodoglobus sp.]